MKKFAKWLVTALVVTCICCLTIGLTACGEKAKTVKSVEVNSNGELVAIYDNEEKVTLGKLSNVRSAEEKDGKLVITLVDGKTIEVPTKIDVPEQVKSVKSIASANGVLTITYTDGTTETVKVADKAVKSVAVKDGKLVVTLFDGTTEEVPLPSEKAVKDVTYDAGKIKITYTDGSEEILNNACKHDSESAIWHEIEKHSYDKVTKTFTNGVYIVECPDCGQNVTIIGVHHDNSEQTHAATCTEDGYTAVTCKVCGFEGTHINPVKAEGHKFGSHEVSGGNICEEGQMTVDVCSVCHETVTHWIEPTGHDLDLDYKHMTVPTATTPGSISGFCKTCENTIVLELPTLDTVGYTKKDISARKVCTEVGKYQYSIDVEYKNHKYPVTFEVEGVAGTHKLNGKACSKGDTVTITEENKNLLHVLDGEVVTCEEGKAAKGYFVCENENCGASVSILIRKEHEEKADSRQTVEESTCSKHGKYSYICSGCGATLYGELEFAAHTYKMVGDPVKAEDGTLTITFKCDECGDTQVKTGVKIIKETEPSCEHDGTYEWEIDGEKETFVYAPKKEHSIRKGVTKYGKGSKVPYEEYKDEIHLLDEVEPTCDGDGTRAYYVCVECGVSVSITAIANHTYPEDENEIDKHEADCENGGYWEFTCPVCNKLQRDHVTNPLGHNYTDYQLVKNDDGKITGIKGTCSRCQGTNTVNVVEDPVRKVVKEATCKEEGKVEWTCKTANGTETIEETIPKTLHSRLVDGKLVKVAKGSLVEITDADTDVVILDGVAACDKEPASGYYVCAVEGCGESISIKIKAGHVVDKSKPNNSVNAGCDHEGTLDFWCVNCKQYITGTIPATEHDYAYKMVLKNGKFVLEVTCNKCDSKFDDIDTELTPNSTEKVTVASKEDATCEKGGKIVYKVVYGVDEYTVPVELEQLPDHELDTVLITWKVEIKDAEGNVIKTLVYKGHICKFCGRLIPEGEPEVVLPAEPEEPTTND